MSHTQTVTVEVPVTLKVEVEVSFDCADGKWETEVLSIEGDTGELHSTDMWAILENKIYTSAHDIAISQLP